MKINSLILFIIFIALLSINTLQAVDNGGVWRDPVKIYDIGSSYGCEDVQVAFDCNGKAMAVFADSEDGIIYSTASDDGGITWSTRQQVSQDPSPDSNDSPQIAIGCNNNAVCVWRYNVSREDEIWGNSYTATSDSWETPIRISATGSPPDYINYPPQVAIDCNGNAIAVWFADGVDGESNEIWYALYDSSSGWATGSAITGVSFDNRIRPQIAIDCSGNAVCVWHDGADDIKSAFYDPSTDTWTLANVDTSGTNLLPQVAKACDGDSVSVWYDAADGYIYAARSSAGSDSWGSPETVSTIYAGTLPRYELWEFTPSGTLVNQPSGTINISTASGRIPWSVMWSHGGDDLVFGSGTGAGSYGFAAYDFNPSTNSFSFLSGNSPAVDIYSVRWSHDNQFIARGDSGPDVGIYYGFNLAAVPDLTVSDMKFLLNSNTVITGPVLFQGVNEIDATGHTIELNGMYTQAQIILDSNASLLIRNASLNNVQPGSIHLGAGSSLGLRNVTWCQEGDITFTQGHFDIYCDVLISGTGSFVYESNEISTIYENSRLLFDSGMTFSYAATSARDLWQFIDSSSILQLYETTLYSIVPGIQLKKGTLVVEGACPVFNDATNENDGVWLGDGTVANNLILKILDESGLDVKSGYVVYKNV